jgi:hypothetical protein
MHMSLTWKDAVATVLTSGVVLIAYAKLVGWNVPLLGGWRLPTAAVFVLGLATCIAAGSGTLPSNNGWTITAGVLGGVAAVLLVAGLIMDSKVVFTLLAADIVALWAVSTIHHLVS